MAVQWTQEQKAVIDHREGNLLVSAAAGSGKTAVLVERILQMLIDQEDPVSEMCIRDRRKTQYEEATVDEYGVTAVSAVTGILIQNGTDLR